MINNTIKTSVPPREEIVYRTQPMLHGSLQSGRIFQQEPLPCSQQYAFAHLARTPSLASATTSPLLLSKRRITLGCAVGVVTALLTAMAVTPLFGPCVGTVAGTVVGTVVGRAYITRGPRQLALSVYQPLHNAVQAIVQRSPFCSGQVKVHP